MFLLLNYQILRGVHDCAIKVVDFKPLAPHSCGFESGQRLCILSCKEVIQLAFRMSVVLLWCLFMPEIMYGKASEVFFNQ
jgi:hypothetical protein